MSVFRFINFSDRRERTVPLFVNANILPINLLMHGWIGWDVAVHRRKIDDPKVEAISPVVDVYMFSIHRGGCQRENIQSPYLSPLYSILSPSVPRPNVSQNTTFLPPIL